MLERVSNDIKEAMKAKDKDRLEVLRMLKSRLLENKTASKPIPEEEAVIQYSKQLKDSRESFPEGSDHRKKIDRELELLAPYLPQPMSETEVLKLIQNLLGTLPEPAFNGVMKQLSPQIKGRFDGKRASELVKQLLESK